MRGGASDDNLGTVVFSVVILLLVLAVIGALIYLYVYVFKNMSSLYNSDMEIKSKIGSLIRDINFINNQEYKVDVEQSTNINRLSQLVGA